MIEKYCGKHVTKKLLLRKCHVRFILRSALAAGGYVSRVLWGLSGAKGFGLFKFLTT